MDLKELLPFILFAVIGIVGSLSKKKGQKGGQSKKKNVFETFLDELNGRNKPEFTEQPQPIFEVDDLEEKIEFEDYAQSINPSIVDMDEPSQETVTKPVSLLDHFNERQKKYKEKGRREMEVIDIDKSTDVQSYSLKDPEEARKAIVFAEIIKPRYF